MEVIALKDLPKIKPGDDLGGLIVEALKRQGLSLADGDVVVVAQSVVSKAEGRVINLKEVKPGTPALRLAKRLDKDPRELEVILRESEEVVRLGQVLISRTKHGFVCANAGVDHSNVELEHVTLLPQDPDASAKRVREALMKASGVEVAVVVSDTQGRPFRRGTVGFAVGVAGIKPLLDLRGKKDLYGKRLKTTIACPVDALAAAATAVMGEAAEGTPVAIVRGAVYQGGEGSIQELLMPREQDLFK